MKVALLIVHPRVSPVFETTGCSLMIEVADKNCEKQHYYNFTTQNEVEMANELLHQGVQLVVCGAIPYYLEKILIDQGCDVIPFIAGEIDEVIEALRCDLLDSPKYKMPGCKKRQQRKKRRFGKHHENQYHTDRLKEEK